MERFWICRQGGAVEGPFSDGQVMGLFRTGKLTLDDQICLDGEMDWRPVSNELSWIDAKPAGRVLGAKEAGFRRGNTAAAFSSAMAARDREVVKGCDRAMFVMVVLMFLAACVPGLGLLTWPLAGVVALVITVLAVVQMTRGGVTAGIWSLVTGWILVPVMVMVIQVVSLKAFSTYRVLEDLDSKAADVSGP